MAISINPLTYVIYVPRADLTLLQASPEVRELNVNQFRLWLKDLEDDPDYGIYLYKTHNHNTEVELAGLTYARIIEILPPYTVEFEDGQYTVNCVGANHNISDVKVANQVSLIVNNAAGLITNAQIEFASFNGGVSVDLSGPYSGTVFPTGTPQRPVNNWLDAFTIAATRGLTPSLSSARPPWTTAPIFPTSSSWGRARPEAISPSRKMRRSITATSTICLSRDTWTATPL